MHKAQALVSMSSSDHGIQNNVNNSVEGTGYSGKWVCTWLPLGKDDFSSEDIVAGGNSKGKVGNGRYK